MSGKFRTTLRVQMILFIVILTLLLVSGLSVALIRGFESKMREEIDLTQTRFRTNLIDTGKTLIRNMVLISENAIAEFNYSLLNELVSAATQEKEVLYGAVISDQGEVIASSAGFQKAIQEKKIATQLAVKPTEIMVNAQGENNVLEIVAPVFDAGQYWGAIRLGMAVELLNQEVQAAKQRMDQKIAATWNTAFMVMAVFVLLGVLVGMLISHQLTMPIRRLVTIAELISKGNLTHKVIVKSHDEIGELSRSFNQMMNSLSETADAAAAISKGDLSREIVSRSEQDTLNNAFKMMSQYLKDMATVATQISDGDLTVNVTPVSENDILGTAFHTMVVNLAKFMAEIREGTDQIAKEAQSMMSAAEQMATITQQNQAQAHEVSQAAGLTRENVISVASAIEEMTASVAEIARNISQTSEMAQHANAEAKNTQGVIQELAQSSSKIGEISKLIGSIAGQTNLLALNATIEAARAGESGKGFAVVAGEVKDLARQTGSAVTEIDDIVETIQSMAVKATEAVNLIVQVIQQVAETFDSIAVSIQEQTATTNEINRTTQEANHQVGEMFKMNAAIAEAEKQMAQGAEQVKDSALTLSILSSEVYRLLNQFKINQTY